MIWEFVTCEQHPGEFDVASTVYESFDVTLCAIVILQSSTEDALISVFHREFGSLPRNSHW